MATTKKPRSKKKVATSKPRSKKVATSKPAAVAEVPEAKAEAKSPPVPPKDVEPKVVPTKRRFAKSTGRIFHIHLIEGASYGSKGYNFVAGRPFVTADEEIYRLFENNGRLKIHVRKGGA